MEMLNGGLSYRLNEYKCSPRLLELCFELSEAGVLDLNTLKLNIERIRKYPYIDTGMFADAFANVLLKHDFDIENVIVLLLPPYAKSTVSSKCFVRIIEHYIERHEERGEVIKTIRFVLETLQHAPYNYALAMLELLIKIHKMFPDSLKESDFSSFTPLTVLPLQMKSIELIEKVLKDQPMRLAAQVTLIFAQLKGDFFRLKLQEPNVNKDAVIGLLRLFNRLLSLAVANYANYCDKELIEKIAQWVHAQVNEEFEWLQNEIEIINGLFLLSTLFASESLIRDIIQNFSDHKYNESLLNFLLIFSTKNSDVYELFHGSIEKCVHDLNVIQRLPESIKLNNMYAFMRLLIDGKKETSIALLTFVTKLICFTDASAKDEISEISEIYSKMFWRSLPSSRDYCLTIFSSSLANKTAVVPTQILQSVRGILEFSELPKGGQTELFEKIQEIVKRFVHDEVFEVRLECGIVMGLMVKLFNEMDFVGIQELFTQFMKHAMKSSTHSKVRVCYIMGLAALKAHLDHEHLKIIELSSNALIGLLSSWNRENDLEKTIQGQEIVATSIIALNLYLEQCGCLVSSEFYRDTCELLLEQVFLRQRCELTMKAVLELTKTLALYANLIPNQSEFIKKEVRILAESSYLCSYRTFNIDLLVDISECNPAIVAPSDLIYKLVRRNVSAYKRGAFGKICQYFNLQISFETKIAYELIDNGLLIILLERSNYMEGFDDEAHAAMSFLIQKIMSITLVERFDFWLAGVLENLSLSERPKQASTLNAKQGISLSDSAFSLTDLSESLEKEPLVLRNVVVDMVISALNNVNLADLNRLSQVTLKRFLSCLIKICFNISAEKSQERRFYLSGIGVFRGIVKAFTKITSEAGGISILEPFDSQIVSIISSILRASEEGDPLYAACAFGALFSLCSSRSDLLKDLKEENGRICTLVKKAISILKEQEVLWTEEVVENLILLSIIVGLCSLHKSGFDLDSEVCAVLKRKIEECFDAYKAGKLEKNIRASLSGSDRLLLVETWIKLVTDYSVIDGALSVLNGLNSESMESVCLQSIEIFRNPYIVIDDKEILNRLLNQILQFGLEKRESLAIDCLLEVKDSEVAKEHLKKLSNEFLSIKFSDFDTAYALTAVKAQEHLFDNFEDQSVLFDILRSKWTVYLYNIYIYSFFLLFRTRFKLYE